MKDMSYSEQEKKEMRSSIMGGISPQGSAPRYPSGLRLHLEPDQVKKLELEGCRVDQKITIIAEGEISSISNDPEIQDDSKGQSIVIQIKEMDVKKNKKEETSEALYGE